MQFFVLKSDSCTASLFWERQVNVFYPFYLQNPAAYAVFPAD